MRLLPKSIHRCHRYPTKFNSGRDIPPYVLVNGVLVIDGGEHTKARPGKVIYGRGYKGAGRTSSSGS